MYQASSSWPSRRSDKDVSTSCLVLLQNCFGFFSRFVQTIVGVFLFSERGFLCLFVFFSFSFLKVSYRYGTRKGLSTKFLCVFDLEVPEDFVPYNGDGEVTFP